MIDLCRSVTLVAVPMIDVPIDVTLRQTKSPLFAPQFPAIARATTMTMTEEELLAQPDAEHDLAAWYMDDSEEDQRKPHK